MARNHLAVRKKEVDGRTQAGVFTLDDRDRIGELTRMLGGEQNGSAAANHAKHLLDEAKNLTREQP
jgi:DNA repair protein RecN (Recombination protein N)